MEIFFRHDMIREAQKLLIKDSLDVIYKQSHLIAHAPTGLGKTDAVLASAITASKELGYDIFFITPKNSQHFMAHQVVKGIAQKYKIKINSIDLVGKKHLCSVRHLRKLPHEDFYQACKNRIKNGQCAYYINSLKKRLKMPRRFNLSHMDVVDMGYERNACAYEIVMNAVSKSNIVIADYAHVLIPSISGPLFSKSSKSLANTILIIDEAHNLSLRLREQLSASLSESLVKKARKECESLESDELEFISEEYGEWVKNILGNEKEKEIEKESLKVLIERECSMEEMAERLRVIGNEWIENTDKPSACIRMANFLDFWRSEAEEEKFIRIAKMHRYGVSIQKKCLAPDIITQKINDAASAILMSGTMKPLKMHRDVLGLDKRRTIMKEYEDPFPKCNKLIVVDRSVTTMYKKRGKDEYTKIAERIQEYVEVTPGNVAVFFPSYEVMRGVMQYAKLKNREVIMQNQNSDAKLIERIKNILLARDDCVLAGVQGGSFSEGVDYENNCIKCVLVVGVPLEEMTLEVRARIQYYQKTFGKGWEYGYAGPAIIRSVQAAGRAVRGEKDKAVIVYMDERFGKRMYDVGEYVMASIEMACNFWNYHLARQLS